MTWLGCQRIDLESCASTNDEAARYARAGASHGTIVIAERQEAGRGREGRAWASPSGGLYFSAIMRPPLPLADVPPITLAIGIAVCDATRAFGAPAALKWPNDVLIGDKKLAGVLVETQSQGGRLDSVIVGIGVNLGSVPDAPKDVWARAIALAVDREAFVAELIAQLERWVDRYVSRGPTRSSRRGSSAWPPACQRARRSTAPRCRASSPGSISMARCSCAMIPARSIASAPVTSR